MRNIPSSIKVLRFSYEWDVTGGKQFANMLRYLRLKGLQFDDFFIGEFDCFLQRISPQNITDDAVASTGNEQTAPMKLEYTTFSLLQRNTRWSQPCVVVCRCFAGERINCDESQRLLQIMSDRYNFGGRSQ